MELSKRLITIKVYDADVCESITIEGRQFLREIVDAVWQHVTDSGEVPATGTADNIINNTLRIYDRL